MIQSQRSKDASYKYYSSSYNIFFYWINFELNYGGVFRGLGRVAGTKWNWWVPELSTELMYRNPKALTAYEILVWD